MKMKIIILAILTLFLMTACKKKATGMDKATADKVFAAIVTTAKAQGKKCQMGFMNIPIIKEAAKEAGTTRAAFKDYIQTDAGKAHFAEAVKNCE